MNNCSIMVPNTSCFDTICRTCLISDKQLFHISDVFWDEIDLKEIFALWTPFEHTNKDQLPQQMCFHCIQLMYQVYKFFRKCSQAEYLLKLTLKREAQKKESTNTDNNKEQENIVIEIESDEIEDVKPSVKEEIIINEDHTYTKTSENINNDITVKLETEEVGTPEKENHESDSNETILHSQNKFAIKKRNQLEAMNKKKEPNYKCTTCLALFPTYEILKRHRSDTHNTHYKYECEFCQLKCMTKNSLIIHHRTHTGEKPYKCETCDKKFVTNTDLRRHSTQHLPEKPFKCRFCSKEFSRKDLCGYHERKQHTNEEIKCKICGAEFNAPRTLLQHEKSAHGIVDAEISEKTYQQTENGEYICNVCNKTLQTSLAFKNHMLAHGPKNYICKYCQKPFITDNRLKYHISSTHESRKYKCNICNKEYRQKGGLKDHMMAQHQSTPYICEICGKTFAFRGSLKDHRRLHIGDTKYQCKICKRIQANKRRLEEHIVTFHTHKNPYVCEYCGKGFKNKTNYNQHVLIHTTDRKQECHICHKVLAEPRTLKRHLFRHKTNNSL